MVRFSTCLLERQKDDVYTNNITLYKFIACLDGFRCLMLLYHSVKLLIKQAPAIRHFNISVEFIRPQRYITQNNWTFLTYLNKRKMPKYPKNTRTQIFPITLQIKLTVSMYSLIKKEWICSLFKEWILEKSEIRVNLEWTFVLFTHFGVTSGITRNPWVIPVVTPKWVNNTNVHSKSTPNSL